MIFAPRFGESVRIHYNKRVAKSSRWHTAIGRIEIIGKGPGPRNLGVRIGAHLVVVPRGNVVRRERPFCKPKEPTT
jgi:hypothetical protein